MGRLVLGAAGAAVGAYIGGPYGASVGWSLGSAVGTLAYGPDTGPDVTSEGPRLGDLTVGSSTYGSALPISYGAMRYAGNVIWSQNIEESRTEHIEEAGGKGGGGQSVTTATYQYYVSFAVAFCEGVKDDVLRIWANGKLIFDNTGSGEDVLSTDVQFRFYSGSETQEPDSIIEADKGENMTPAFRGVCYIVFDRLPLRNFGNAIPNITAEIASSVEDPKASQELDFFEESEGGLEDDFDITSFAPDYIRESAYFIHSGSTNSVLRRFNTRSMMEDNQALVIKNAGILAVAPRTGTILIYGIDVFSQRRVYGVQAGSLTTTSVSDTILSSVPEQDKSCVVVSGGVPNNEFVVIPQGDSDYYLFKVTTNSIEYVWDTTTIAFGAVLYGVDLSHASCARGIGTSSGYAYLLGSNTALTSFTLHRIKVSNTAEYSSGTTSGIFINTIVTLSAADIIPGESSISAVRGLVYDNTDDSLMFQAAAGSDSSPYMVKVDVTSGSVLWRSEIPNLRTVQYGMNQSLIVNGLYGQVDADRAWQIRTSSGEVVYDTTGFDPESNVYGAAWYDGKSKTVLGATSTSLVTPELSSSFNTSTDVSIARDITFNPGGSKMFVCDFNNGVAEYSIDSILDISTASYINTYNNFTGQTGGAGTVTCIAFDSTGDNVFTTRGYQYVQKYSLGSAYSTSTPSLVQEVSLTPNIQAIAFSPDGTKMYILSSGAVDRIYQYDLSSGFDLSTAGSAVASFYTNASPIFLTDPQGLSISSDGSTIYLTGSDESGIFVLSLSTAWELSTASYDTTYTTPSGNTGVFKTSNPNAIGVTRTNNVAAVYSLEEAGFAKWFLDRNTGVDVPLSDIVTDLIERSGLTSSDIEVSDLTSTTVHGYVVSRTSTIRAIIQQLASTFFFDAVESDYTLKFLLRDGKSSAATIPQAELALIDGQFIQKERIEELELPNRFTLTYYDKDRDYQQSAQSSKRILNPNPSVQSRDELGTSLPVALGATQAKQITEKVLYSSWIERNSYNAIIPWTYLDLDPNDVITLSFDTGDNIRTRIIQSDLGLDMSIGIAALEEDDAQYTSTVEADSGDFPDQEILSNPYSKLILVNSPLLRDSDDTGRSVSLLYFFIGGFGQDGWTAASLLKSDSGVQFSPVGAAVNEMTWGTASNALGDTSLPFQTDETNTLTVYMNTGADNLESITQLEMVNGANAAALIHSDGIDVEIIQFRDVATNDDGSKTLSGLLRGRRGTEVFTSGHAQGDIFVLLNGTSGGSLNLNLGEKDQDRYFKAVTSGQLPEDAFTITNASPLNDLKPYAVKHAEAVLDVGNDIDLSWVRQTRVGGQLQDGTGTVPVSEDAEEYEIEIFDGPGGTEVREVTGLSSPEYTYTSADQTTDGFSPPLSQLTVKIYQISAQVGRGFSTEVTLNVE